MTRALVVVEPRESIEELLGVASDFARGGGAELVLFHAADKFENDTVRDRMRDLTGREQSYRTGIEGAREFATDLGEAFLADDIDFEVAGAFGDKADRILNAIEQEECDHVFLTGRRRSPTGKAMFGDVTQSVLLNADVPVTVVMD